MCVHNFFYPNKNFECCLSLRPQRRILKHEFLKHVETNIFNAILMQLSRTHMLNAWFYWVKQVIMYICIIELKISHGRAYHTPTTALMYTSITAAILPSILKKISRSVYFPMLKTSNYLSSTSIQFLTYDMAESI